MGSQTEKHKGEGHRKRLRDRFLTSGLSGFSDYEVVELLLTLGTPRKDCKSAAKEAIRLFETLPKVLEASQEELQQVKGIGPVNAFGIKLIKAVSERYLEQRVIEKDVVSSSKELLDLLNVKIRDKSREQFMVVFLTAKNSVIKTQVLFEGTLTASSVYPREVVQAALDAKAAALIFAHNHPSGDPTPSQADIDITKKLTYALSAIGIQVHEHMIVAEKGHFSFAEAGYIAAFQASRKADVL